MDGSEIDEEALLDPDVDVDIDMLDPG